MHEQVRQAPAVMAGALKYLTICPGQLTSNLSYGFAALVCWMSVRTLIALALTCVATQAQSPLVKILSDELDRNFTILKQKGDPPPYFMGYEVTDDEAEVVTASRGSLDTDNHAHRRSLDVTVRVGEPEIRQLQARGNGPAAIHSAGRRSR